MWKTFLALMVGLAVAAVVFLLFAAYTWTAIHRFSDAGIQAFYAGMLLAPLALGLLAGWATYRVTGGRRQSGSSKGCLP